MTIRERNKRRRLIGWVVLYLLVIVGFVAVVYWQSTRVNTLGFASGQLQITVPKTQFMVGEAISYTLKNGLNKDIALENNCPQEPLHIYSWINNTWVRIHDTAVASACAGQPPMTVIPAGGSTTQNFAKWPNLFAKPGIYRVVGLATNYSELPYADFQVVAKGSGPQIIYQQVYTPIYITVPGAGGGTRPPDDD